MKKYVQIDLLVKLGWVERRIKSTKEEWDLKAEVLASWLDMQKEAGESDELMEMKFSLGKYLLSFYYAPHCSRHQSQELM